MPDRTETRVHDLAGGQHGLVTRQQLLSLGLSSSAIGRRIRAGWLRRIHAGVYRVGPIEAPRAAEMAAVLAGGPGAVLSHTSALKLWDLSRADRRRPIHVSVPGNGRSNRPGVRFHRVALLEDERSAVDGVPITAPARTLIDVAGMLGTAELERAVARAEREGVLSPAELGALPEKYAGRPGIGSLRALIQSEHEPDLTRSRAERLCIDLLARARLPRPRTNVPVGPYELDLYWPDLGVAIEVDGRAHHSGTASFEGDRRKDRWLGARGIRVIRLTWSQITREPLPTAVEVGQILAIAELQRSHPPS